MTRQEYSFWRVNLESDECGKPQLHLSAVQMTNTRGGSTPRATRAMARGSAQIFFHFAVASTSGLGSIAEEE